MDYQPWQVWTLSAWAIVVFVTIGLAAAALIPWVVVSAVTLLTCSVGLIRWQVANINLPPRLGAAPREVADLGPMAQSCKEHCDHHQPWTGAG